MYFSKDKMGAELSNEASRKELLKRVDELEKIIQMKKKKNQFLREKTNKFYEKTCKQKQKIENLEGMQEEYGKLFQLSMEQLMKDRKIFLKNCDMTKEYMKYYDPSKLYDGMPMSMCQL